MVRNWRLSRRKRALEQRARIVQAIRLFFIDRGFLEVETPHRIPAPAPESHIDAVSSGAWFLHPSPEICMKRLLAAGYGKIFQVSRCWREGERGRQHVPEFTLLEWYRTNDDYRALMEDCEMLIQSLASTLGLGQSLIFQNQEIGLTAPWERISVRDAFRSYTNVTPEEALERDLFDERMVQAIEPLLGMKKPTFLCDYPAERGTLARLRKDDPTVAERFELYIGGLELANGFSELVDPEEQRKRFLLEQANRRSLGKPVYPMPEPFLDELEDMPPSAGIALGVDRLVMVLLNAATIDDVVAFTPEEL
jgi:lysyl-tRNA synthetase class 2